MCCHFTALFFFPPTFLPDVRCRYSRLTTRSCSSLLATPSTTAATLLYCNRRNASAAAVPPPQPPQSLPRISFYACSTRLRVSAVALRRELALADYRAQHVHQNPEIVVLQRERGREREREGEMGQTSHECYLHL
jgi:hypothetical protein